LRHPLVHLAHSDSVGRVSHIDLKGKSDIYSTIVVVADTLRR
jgi:hypothetical protein